MKGTATPINNHGFFCGPTVNIEQSTDTEHRALKSSVVNATTTNILTNVSSNCDINNS